MRVVQDEFVVIGELLNDEHYPCLICKNVPDRIMQNVYLAEKGDIPRSLRTPSGKKVVFVYSLCLQCYADKPQEADMRRLMLERIRAKQREIM